MKKVFGNISKLSLVSSFIISAFILAMILVFFRLLETEIQYQYSLILFILITIFCFLVIQYLLRRFIYTRIVPIYKIINKHSINDEEQKRIRFMQGQVIEEVEEEVDIWMKSRDEEVEKFKSLAEYRKRFIGDISHELKTPLFSIQSYLETLIEGALYDKENNMKFLKKAAKNTDRLSTIIDDLEVIARLESGEYGLEIDQFSISEMIHDVFDELQMKAKKSNIELSLKNPTSDFMVTGDPIQIRQVLINLINNSIKYGKNGGITECALYDMDQHILIEVSDDGLGIENDHLPHIFGRFYRIDKSRSREKGGSGLGLSIVKHIIEAHEQTINVKSTPGQGSTFGFTLEKVL